MKKACEYFFWSDFPDFLEETNIFEDEVKNISSITMVEESPYTFSVNVEDESGEVINFTMSDMIDKWYKVDDMEEVEEMHCDNQGIWVIYERRVDL